MKHVVLSIDLKSFYASVECLDRGLDPFSTPLVVADEQRGDGTIVLAASPYIKEKYDVKSRCRLYEVDKTIPGLIIAQPRMERYIKVSAKINMIYLSYVSQEDLHVYSIDESFLDITDYLHYSSCDPYLYARRIIDDIKNKTGLTVTCGIGENIFLAKVAMDIEAKHNADNIAYWKKKDIVEKLWNISPLSKMWGIGRRLEKRLNSLGFYKVGDIASASKDYLKKNFGIIGEEIYYHSLGYDDAVIKNKVTSKNRSLSAGQVLLRDYDANEIETIIRSMAIELSDRMYDKKVISNSFSMYINFSQGGGLSFKLFIPLATASHETIGKKLASLFLKDIDKYREKKFRGVYLCANDIYFEDTYQLSLFDSEEKHDRQIALEKTTKEIRKLYGVRKAMPCSSLNFSSTFLDRSQQIGGHHR
ncbi:MAG: hypothetical protein SPK64_00060 [Candidatus Enterosoma sp.]|nr:hypothetical protein [Candidatus Enterosoma sp.]MDY5649435.1 hypothetical protein [Candidatus Enterosoma sp.]